MEFNCRSFNACLLTIVLCHTCVHGTGMIYQLLVLCYRDQPSKSVSGKVIKLAKEY